MTSVPALEGSALRFKFAVLLKASLCTADFPLTVDFTMHRQDLVYIFLCLFNETEKGFHLNMVSCFSYNFIEFQE